LQAAEQAAILEVEVVLVDMFMCQLLRSVPAAPFLWLWVQAVRQAELTHRV
jgi:hypothetical protein